MDQLALDELRVLPTGDAWHKARMPTDAKHRLAMAEMAFSGVPGVVIDPREVMRKGPSYTVDSLGEIHREQPQAELLLIIGEDQARALETWHQWQKLPELAIICVAARAQSTGAEGQFVPKKELESRFQALRMPLLSVSATDIRARVANHQDVVPLVGEAVARYIDQHHLYEST